MFCLLVVACAALLSIAECDPVCTHNSIGTITDNVVPLPPTNIDSMSARVDMPQVCVSSHVGTLVTVCDQSAASIIMDSMDEARVYRSSGPQPPATVKATLYCDSADGLPDDATVERDSLVMVNPMLDD